MIGLIFDCGLPARRGPAGLSPGGEPLVLRTFSADEMVVVAESPRYMIHDPSLLDSVPFAPAARVVVGGRLSFPPGINIVGRMLFGADDGL